MVFPADYFDRVFLLFEKYLHLSGRLYIIKIQICVKITSYYYLVTCFVK